MVPRKARQADRTLILSVITHPNFLHKRDTGRLEKKNTERMFFFGLIPFVFFRFKKII